MSRGASRPPPATVETIDEPPGPLGSGTEAEPRLCVEAWLAVATDAGWRTLLLRRTPQNGSFWQGVSGRVEAHDASLRAAAIREIREETGISDGVTIVDLGRTSVFRGVMTGRWFRKHSLGAILPRGVAAERLTLSDEHDLVEIVSFAEARARVRFPENVLELETLERLLAEDRGPARAAGAGEPS